MREEKKGLRREVRGKTRERERDGKAICAEGGDYSKKLNRAGASSSLSLPSYVEWKKLAGACLPACTLVAAFLCLSLCLSLVAQSRRERERPR